MAILPGMNRLGTQTAQHQRSAQGINDPQHLRQSHRGLSGFELDNETHAHTGGKRKLRLGQAQAFPGCSQRGTQRLSCGNGGHGWQQNFLFGQLLSSISQSLILFTDQENPMIGTTLR
jgi:hypothetical protein